MIPRTFALPIAAALLAFAGCTAVTPINPPIDRVDLASGYRMAQLIKREQRRNHPEAMVLLAFSGGGTRAAALSYGVLEELRRTPITVGGQPEPDRTFLDEVDLITGVSGGSFTALAYALYGERLFTEFEPRFLKRDVQGELIARALSPRNWGALGTARYGRSELAADYYDEILFGGATFGDLLKRPGAPAALVTGTDLSTGSRFEFSQEQFDLMCSDLSPVRLARAAATSSAVPVVLSPVTWFNYGGRCGAVMPGWVQDVVTSESPTRPAGRALLRYREIEDLADSARRPYIHVVDGGISDNLGLRGALEAFEELEASKNFRKQLGFDALRHIVVIVVNSRSDPSTDWDRSSTPPGFVWQLLQSSSLPIDHFSSDSVELLKDIAQRWANQRRLEIAEKRIAGMTKAQAEAAVPALSFDAIDVSFEAIADPAERRYFMDLPTSFTLPPEAVDRLRAVGGRLLRESRSFQALLRQIETNRAAMMGTTGTAPSPKPP